MQRKEKSVTKKLIEEIECALLEWNLNKGKSLKAGPLIFSVGLAGFLAVSKDLS